MYYGAEKHKELDMYKDILLQCLSPEVRGVIPDTDEETINSP